MDSRSLSEATVSSVQPEFDCCQASASDPFVYPERGSRLPDQTLTAGGVVTVVAGPSQTDDDCSQLSYKGANLVSDQHRLSIEEFPDDSGLDKSSSVSPGPVDQSQLDRSSNLDCLSEEGEHLQEPLSEVVSGEDFLRADASSTLKAQPLKAPLVFLSEEGSRQGLEYCGLDVDSVASVLPHARTSAEEAALDLLTLEAEHSRRNRRLPLEDINGSGGEQDSGIFDLSLLQQEDCESLEERDRQQRTARHKPLGLRRTFPLTHCLAVDASVNGPIKRENQRRVKRNFPIPSCFDANPSPEVQQDPDIQWTIEPPPVELEVSEAPQTPIVDPSEDRCTVAESVDPAVPLFPEEDTESVSDQLFESESSDSAQDSGPDSVDGDPPNSDMGKKTQSLPRGSQPHVVYSKDEFCEEYASPQKSKSLDRKKKKKGGDKKDQRKSKDRKKVLLDPNGGGNLRPTISGPMPAPQNPNRRHKRHTVGPVPRSPTQEAGTDTVELQADPEVTVVHHQQPNLSLSAANGLNNNREGQCVPKARKSGTEEGAPEAVICQPYSPEVISELVGKASGQLSDIPPPKPKRLSLTNQLQKPIDKPLDALGLKEGSPSMGPGKSRLCERKTEIAVERQVLLKQATKVESVNGNASDADDAKCSQNAHPYTVVSRYIDGEEELILGALPLEEAEALPPARKETPSSGVPKRQGKQLAGGRKFRHYACIEPVGTPLQAPVEQKPEMGVVPSSSPATTAPQEPASPVPTSNHLTSSLSITLADPAWGAATELSPPLAVTEEMESPASAEVQETSPVPFEQCADSGPAASTEASPQPCGSSTEDVEEKSSLAADASPSLEVGRSRQDSSADTASTVSIPPQSPSGLADQDVPGLELTANPVPSSFSSPSSSPSCQPASTTPTIAAATLQPSVFINYIEPDTEVLEQKMVTVAVAMMPQPQTPEVTMITPDEGLEVNSTDEVEAAEEAQQLQETESPETKEECTDADQASPEPVTHPVATPSVSSEEGDNEEDEDSGVYDASYRHSDWIYVGNTQELQMITKQAEGQPGTPTTMQTVAEVNEVAGTSTQTPFDRGDETRESVTTTASENEFRTQHQSLAYRRVHRKTSAIDYQRLSLIARERNVTIKKVNKVFGFRIQYSKPVVVTDIDKGGAAEEAGLRIGDMVLKVNGQDVRQSPHSQVVRLAMADPNAVNLVVGTNVCNTLNLYAEKPVMSGYLHKLGGAGMIRTWKKRWFVLKHDNCLYYYKTEDDVEPLGAIVLCNYTVMKARDVGKSFAFKLTKCKARTYYFYTPTEEEMSRWAKHITEAAKPQNASDIWLDISTHNVGLPALSIKNPDCHGFLNKMGAVRKNWKRRYCVLKDACLYYYKDMDAHHALGVAHFHGYSIQETEIGSKKFGLILKPPSDELRIFYFFADHETDRKRWVAAFALSIGRWIKTNTGEESDDDSAEMLI